MTKIEKLILENQIMIMETLNRDTLFQFPKLHEKIKKQIEKTNVLLN